ncbi:STE/STE11 protein kinase [Saprolegnia parasitica CBS 223.65]|uniref:STE/STE11 protein kinase n=1 Tax=Saprolegnia parasitica (strain CBS 223.65) TaxID=695850 RepID=A0A067CBJ4_SAPPC|nr:STE/STE11 protein kinase [Saprolegnia parasitica CBS 223.65]KDO23911.1 STE/STE11 protein kinase [Saprolegnia parasitica CBS 223.65]|eukprot:XP_012205379.1 STE/STE11 protein kinase [Saprolegnia parasitica CBS 223.65]
MTFFRSPRLAVHRYARVDAATDASVLAGVAPLLVTAPLTSLAVTADEISVVLPATVPLPTAPSATEDGWVAFKVEGPLDFGLTGILSALTAPLASVGIPVFAISTYDTDYILVKHDKADAAIDTWTTTEVGVIRLVVWQRGKLIGHGRFGKVYVGILLASATMVAVKQLRIQGHVYDDDEVDTAATHGAEVALAKIEQEAAIGQALRHPHIVQYYGAQREGGIYSLFMEYLPMGSVHSLLQTFGPLDESIVCVYTSQLLRGLQYLHAIGLAHRDIKCANLLLSDSGCLKIADFGTAKTSELDPKDGEVDDELFATVGSVRDGIGSPFWMSPEIIRAELGADAWTKSDVWSVGCCVVEMVTGEPPWNTFSNPLTAMFHIASETSAPVLPSHLSPVAHDFVMACLTKDPAQRPTASMLLQHAFSTRFRETSVEPDEPGAWYLYYDWTTNAYEYAYYIVDDGGYWVYRVHGAWDWLLFPLSSVVEIALWWLAAVRFLPPDEVLWDDADPNASVYTVSSPVPYASMPELTTEEPHVPTTSNPTPELAPDETIDATTSYVRVLADYATTTEGELALAEHELIVVKAMDDNGWWLGHKADDPSTAGWFPCTILW